MVLEILVSGLCAFVRESCAIGNAKAVNVIMLEGEEAHSPRLLINADYVKPPYLNEPPEVANGRTLTEVLELPNGEQYFVWDLTDCRFEIVDAPSIGIVEGGRNETTLKPSDDPHGKDQPDDFSWVPELHKSCGVETSKAKADPLTLDDKKLPSYAVARMMKLKVDPTATAKNNWLEADMLGNASNQEIYVFEPNPYKQVLADRARITMRLEQSPVRLRLVSYKGKPTREIELKPPAGSNRIQISLSNMPKTQQREDGMIMHFKSYKKLLKTNLNTCAVPVEEKVFKKDHHIAPVKCTLCSACTSD